MEKQLIQKAYYETLMSDESSEHPIRVLAEAYLVEQMKDMPDLAAIRFAQGEVYFHHKDFESAIFKWSNLENEFEPWAKKNTADAYYELGMLANAEDYYKSVTTDSTILNTEVSLQLFSLYIEKGDLEQAVRTIKHTINRNPDYPNVTELGRAFFEGEKDWNNAIELATNEAIRTKSIFWFDVLQSYGDKGLTRSFAPEYFSEALRMLHYLDRNRFEKLASALWDTYKNEDTYFSWINMLNHILSETEVDRAYSWSSLSVRYHETFLELTNGNYLIEELKNTIPLLLENWFIITDSAQAAAAASALLAWGEIFPGSIRGGFMGEAENLVSS
ncbi:MAG: GTP-binding protein, partial [Bacillota bacterium]|nr:GTP-binding protein [Bacillota bacterium]